MAFGPPGEAPPVAMPPAPPQNPKQLTLANASAASTTQGAPVAQISKGPPVAPGGGAASPPPGSGLPSNPPAPPVPPPSANIPAAGTPAPGRAPVAPHVQMPSFGTHSSASPEKRGNPTAQMGVKTK